MDYFDFKKEMVGIIEEGGWIAATVYNLRPYASIEDLYEKFCNIIDLLPTILQVGMIRCYPQLVSTKAEILSKESTKEHDTHLGNIDATESLSIKDLNKQYLDKFQFPFICCVRENSVKNIIDLMRERISNAEMDEIKCNVYQIKRIAWYRLVETFSKDSKL